MAESGGLLSRYTGKPVSRVRIPLSPPFFISQKFFSGFFVYKNASKHQCVWVDDNPKSLSLLIP